MKIRTIKNSFALTAIAMTLSACGSSSSEDNEPAIGAAVGAEQAATASASTGDTDLIVLTDEELGVLAEVPDTETARLQVFDDFAFDTARSTNVYMLVPDAIGVSAEATFCTDYTLQADGDYDVDYKSCVFTTPMFGGVVDEELNLVNQHKSVLGIVWFQDTTMAPQYQEFRFD